MAANPETLDSSLENSELLQLKKELSSLKKEVEEGVEPSVTKGPEKLKDGLVSFVYEKSARAKWQIFTRKSGNSYTINVERWTPQPDGSWGWNSGRKIKYYKFTATDKTSFNKEFSYILNNAIGTDRDKLPKTGGKVYDMLNTGSGTKF